MNRAHLQRGLAILGALVCLVAARPKEERPERDARVFRKHLDSARTHFNGGQYERAAKEWGWAYKTKRVAPLLFNQAQAYRLSGHFEEARSAYATYLKEIPEAPNRAEVLSHIRTMTRYIHHPPKHLTKSAAKDEQ